MKAVLLGIDKKYQKIEYLFVIVAGVLLFLTMFLLALNILTRSIFNQPIVGAYEIVVNLFAALVSLGFSYVQGQKGNIAVEVVTDLLPAGIQRVLVLAGYLIGLYVIGVIAWQSGLHTWSSFINKEFNSNSILQLPTWPINAIITWGMLTLFIRLIIDVLLQLLPIAVSKEAQNDEVKIVVQN
jgi:TRAP-type transport system small permease protein